jgi:hypothetical protein
VKFSFWYETNSTFCDTLDFSMILISTIMYMLA